VSRKTNDSVPPSALVLLKLLDEFIFTSVLLETTSSFSRPKKKTIILGVGGGKSTSVFTWNLRRKKEKGIIVMEQAFLPFYLMPQSQVGLISQSSTRTVISEELDLGGGGRLFVRNRERTLACVNRGYPRDLFFQGRKGSAF